MRRIILHQLECIAGELVGSYRYRRARHKCFGLQRLKLDWANLLDDAAQVAVCDDASEFTFSVDDGDRPESTACNLK